VRKRLSALSTALLAGGVLAFTGCGGGDDDKPERASTAKAETGPTASGTSPNNRRTPAETKRATARQRASAKRANDRRRAAARKRAAGTPTSRESKQASASTERLYRAVRSGDGAGICRQLSGAARRRLTKATDQPTCVDGIVGAAKQGRGARRGKVTALSLQGKKKATATVTFGGGATGRVLLVKQGGDWKVDEFTVPAPASAEKQ